MSEDTEVAFKKLEVPEFKSTIPSYLLDGASPQTKYLLENLNINTQQNTWLISSALNNSTNIHNINTRLVKVEKFKGKVTDYRVVIVGIIIALVSFVEVVPATVWSAKWILSKASDDNTVEVSSGLQIAPQKLPSGMDTGPINLKKKSPLVIQQTGN